MTNTQAYHGPKLITVVKKFCSIVASVVKHFKGAIYNYAKLARVFAPGRPFQPSLFL